MQENSIKCRHNIKLDFSSLVKQKWNLLNVPLTVSQGSNDGKCLSVCPHNRFELVKNGYYWLEAVHK